MTRIDPHRSASDGRLAHEGPSEAEPAPGRDLALVQPAAPADDARHFAQPRPQAAFLAHLLAVAQRAPQTLEKRRAEPQEAANRYIAAGTAAPARPGRALKRAV